MEFTIYLLRKGIRVQDAVKTDASTVVQQSNAGTAFLFPSDPAPPNWVEEVSRLWPNVRPADVQSSRGGCVLHVEVADDQMFVTFGTGHLKVNRSCVVRDFGRKTTINAVHPGTIKQVSRQALEGNFIHAIESAAKSGSVLHFGIDPERDILEGLVGQPRWKVFGKLIGGATALRVSLDGGLQALLPRLRIYRRLYLRTIRLSDFSWYERMRFVDGPHEISALDATLDERIRDGGEDVMLGLPFLMEGTDQVSMFQFERGRRAYSYPDPEFPDWIEWCGQKGLPPTLDLAARKPLITVLQSGATREVSIADSIIFEFTGPNGIFVRHNGDWLRVDADFVESIRAFTDSLTPSGLPIPPYAHANEAEYNRRVSTALAGSVCLDGRLVRLPGANSAIEPCDIYLYDPAQRRGYLVFVKRKKSGSVGLTHLISQMSVGIDAFFHRSDVYRREMEMLMGGAGSLGFPAYEPPDPSMWMAVLVVCGTRRGGERLPFLTATALKRVADTLASRYQLRLALHFT